MHLIIDDTDLVKCWSWVNDHLRIYINIKANNYKWN